MKLHNNIEGSLTIPTPEILKGYTYGNTKSSSSTGAGSGGRAWFRGRGKGLQPLKPGRALGRTSGTENGIFRPANSFLAWRMFSRFLIELVGRF